MKRTILLAIAIIMIVSTSLAQKEQKKLDKLFMLYSQEQYTKAIEYATKLRSKNYSKAATYFVEGLSYFGIYKQKAQDSKLRSATYKIKLAVKYDTDGKYQDFFSTELKEFKDTLNKKSEELLIKQQIDQAKFYSKKLVEIFNDTTAAYKELFIKPKLEAQRKAEEEKKAKASNTLIANYQGPINQLDEQARRQGLWVKYSPEGNPLYEIMFKDGHPAGSFRKYYPTGELLVQMYFEPTGHLAGAIYYDKTGKKMAMGYYRDKKRDSLWQFFYNDSIVMWEITYKNGLKNGPERLYNLAAYPNLLEEKNWKNDTLDGKFIEYFDTGIPKRILFFRHGKLDSTYYLFRYDGSLKLKGKYVNGSQEGPWIYFNEDGSTDTVMYKNGVPTNKNMTRSQMKLEKALESAKGLPEPEEMFKKEFGLEEF